MLVAVAAMAFTACQKDNEELDRKVANSVNYTFTAEFDSTRASFGELDGDVYPVTWDKNETFGFKGDLISINDGSIVTDCSFYPTTTEFPDDNTVVLTVTSLGSMDEYYSGIADNSVVKAYTSNNVMNWNGELNTDGLKNIQTPTATSVDPNFVGLAAEFEIVNAAESSFNGTFKHVTAYGKLNVPAIDGVDIETVKIELTDASDVTMTYTLNVAELEEQSYWFACAPVAATKINVQVAGSGKLYEYEKEFAEDKALTFTAGHVKPLTINATLAEGQPYSMRVVDYGTMYLYVSDVATGNDVAMLALEFDPAVKNLPEGKYPVMGTSEWTALNDSMQVCYPYAYYTLDYDKKIVSIELSVMHLTDGYAVALSMTDADGNIYAYSYEGYINGIWNPGDPTPLTNPVVTKEITATSATFAWEAVEGAVSYEVKFDGNTTNTTELTYTATDLKPNTRYSFGITAVAAESDADHVNSETVYVEFTTPMDFSVACDYEVTLTKITEIDGNTITFTGDDAKDWIRIPFNPGLSSIVEGVYTCAYSWIGYKSSTSLEYGYDQFDLSAYPSPDGGHWFDGEVSVSIDGDTYTIIALTQSLWNSDISASQSVKFTYTGKLEVAAPDVKLYLDGGLWATTQENGKDVWFAAYFWSNDNNTWAKMSAVEGETGLFEVVVPDGEWVNVIFTRMNPDATALDWSSRVDENNQTVDLVIPTDGSNLFTIEEAWNSAEGYKATGSWSKYGEEGGEGGEGVAFVRAEYDFQMKLYAYNGGDAEYAFRLYDANDNYLEVICEFGNHTDWEDKYTVNYTKDGNTVSGYKSLSTQKPNNHECADGEMYYVVIVTLSDGTEFDIQDQIPSTEVNLYE